MPPEDVPTFSVIELPLELGSITLTLSRCFLFATVVIDCVTSAAFNRSLPLPVEL